MSGARPADPKRENSKSLFSRVSLAWLLPLAAIAFAISVLWHNFVERGPLVRIQFDDAGGVVAGETRIRRNDVTVGTVEAVRLADDLNSVIIEARMDPMVAPFLDEDARFWIVKARINTTEVSGLSTLLSGSYIGVDWDDSEKQSRREFQGLEEPPLTVRGTKGRRLTLASEEAGYVIVGSPVFFRQIEVGRVERRRLSSDATEVLFDIFIEEPHHHHVYPDSRFYSVTGLEANLSADGVTVRVESIAAFFTGGIAFDNPPNVAGVEPISRDGLRYTMYGGRTEARERILDGEEDERFRFLARFPGSVKGLKRDAPIEYNGIRIGRVADVSIELPTHAGDPPIAVATLQFQPQKLGFDSVSPGALTDGLENLIERGLRVQLASGNLLTGSLLVRLVNDPGASPAELNRDAAPFPELPTIPSSIGEVTQDVEQLIANLSELPLDELITTATGLFGDFRAIVASPEVGQLPAQLSESLDALSKTAQGFEGAATGLPDLITALTDASLNADDVLEGLTPDSEIYIELSATVRELKAAARSIAAFAEILEDNPNAVITGRR